jgi:RNA polymerase sigma-70 factor (ECF subfamily)
MEQAEWDQVILAIRGGETDRFREIVAEFQDRLRFVIGYHLRGSPDLVEEVLHCAFIEIYKSLPKFELGRPLAPWLQQIARTEAIKEFRHRQRASAHETEMLGFDIADHRQKKDAPVEKLEKLSGCLERMQQTARQVIQAHYFDGLGFDAIARNMGTSAASLRVQMFKIRRALRECIERPTA